VKLLVLGAGYVGARLAELAFDRGDEVVLADNWYATERSQLTALEARGARVETADIRVQASRMVAERDPAYTESTNFTGTRLVAEELAARDGPRVVFGSSLHVYGANLAGQVGPDHPYGAQRDLAHLSKIYGELVLGMHSSRARLDLAIARLGIVYGPSPVEHDRPESVTVVDKFRRLVAAGEEPRLDDGGSATIGIVHVEDAARALLDARPGASNIAAETITVADVARLARGEERRDEPAFRITSPYTYRYGIGEYLPG
jgi:nucleoside-diphosphate-sugar epimerase